MTKIPTGYDVPIDNGMSDADLKARLVAEHKQTNVKKSNFPTEMVPLPSKGLVYPEGHPLADGVIEMKYMTAREEDILTSQNLIKQGVVLDKLFESLIVTPMNYGDLYVGDKNAIMVAARVLGYGKEYTVEIDDPFSPGNKQNLTIDLTQIDSKPFEHSNKGVNEFSYTLPSTNTNITYKILTHGDEQKIQAEIDGFKKINKNASVDLSTRLKYMITSVEGDRETKTIREFIDNHLLARDSRALRKHIAETQPDVDLTFFPDDSDIRVNIPIGIKFFWPDF